MTDEQITLDDLEVVINPDTVEPAEYFRLLKDSIQHTNENMLEANLTKLGDLIIKARKIGQKAFLHKLAFAYQTIVKEQALLAAGINKYVYQDDIKTFLDKVKEVKIIELERYPRAIPDDNMAEIQKAKEMGLFDDFVVVFTDLTGKDYKTEDEKQYGQRS